MVVFMKLYVKIKRILDFVFAILLLIILSPVFLLSAVLIKLETKGPIIFKQKRPGRDLRPFTVYKFRTMCEANKENDKRDIDRITKVGSFLRKTSIDELPQLFNILKGEMSFIGPRPLLVEYASLYSSWQIRRHELSPGISGLAQINGRNRLCWEQKFELDIWYIDNISFMMDLKIVFATIKNVIKKSGINSSDKCTMPNFKGNL
jgi:lipopolysaccharide/colanic/teichoic acid biosynthesis glycosyltransferase